MAELLRRFVQPGDVILDPCCGSGTTGVVALKLGCHFTGIDEDPKAVKTARNRLAGMSVETANPV